MIFAVLFGIVQLQSILHATLPTSVDNFQFEEWAPVNKVARKIPIKFDGFRARIPTWLPINVIGRINVQQGNGRKFELKTPPLTGSW